MSQTTYNTDFGEAFQGLLDYAAPGGVLSRANGEGSEIPFGIMLTTGTDPYKEAELPDAAGDDALGVVVHRHHTNTDATGDDAVEDNEDMDVLSRGRVWVLVEEQVDPGDDVYFRHTANGGNTQLGAFRQDADTANATQVTGARWIKGGSSIALLELNLP